MKKLLKPKRILIAVVILLVLGGIMYFRNRGLSAGNAPVKTVKVEQRIVTKTVSASGRIVSDHTSSPSFSASGKVVKLNFDEGDTVQKGQLIAEIDSQAIRESAQAAKDTRDIAIRNKELFIEQYASDKDLVGGSDQYQIRLRTLDEEISRAQANYDAASSNIKNAFIYAPSGGTITRVNTKEGETAIAGSPVVEISDLSKTHFEIVLDQEDIGFITEGQKVELELDSYSNSNFNGSVYEIPGYADVDGNFAVKIEILDDSERNLFVGMQGDAYIVVETTEKPVSSLLFDEIQYDEMDKPFVWTVEEGMIRKTEIQTGLEGDVYTEVLTDLGDMTVVIALNDSVDIKEGFTASIVQ
jgi:HlyD family secretion protein